jgi:hypothetical protein
MKEPAANKPAGSWMPRFRVTAEKERPKKKKSNEKRRGNSKEAKRKTTVFASSSGQLFSKFPSCVWCREKLRVFENRVLRRIFEPRRDEVMGGWKKTVLFAKYN